MSTAFQLLDVPNKEELLQNIKQMSGQDPLEEDLSPEEIKQKLIQKLQVQQKQAHMMEQVKQKMVELEMQNKDLENKKLMAEIAGILNEQKLAKADMVLKLRENVLQLPQRGVQGAGNNQTKREGNRPQGGGPTQRPPAASERKKPAGVPNAVAGQS
jgi:L-lactate utilization protein LutC